MLSMVQLMLQLQCVHLCARVWVLCMCVCESVHVSPNPNPHVQSVNMSVHSVRFCGPIYILSNVCIKRCLQEFQPVYIDARLRKKKLQKKTFVNNIVNNTNKQSEYFSVH